MEVPLHEHREHRRAQCDGAHDTQRHQRRLPRGPLMSHAERGHVLQLHHVLQPPRGGRDA
jgi:hypothetical protein